MSGSTPPTALIVVSLSIARARERARLLLIVGSVWALVVAAPQTATAQQDRPYIAPVTALVRLVVPHVVRDKPGPDGRFIGFVRWRRPLTGEQTVLPVIARAQGSDGRQWIEVRLPGHPLHSKPLPQIGWIRAANTVPERTPWHILINTEARRASIFWRGLDVAYFRVIVGKPSTPTPLGDYFVEENVALSRRDIGAPFALATSARSNVLQEFEGGPGQIALHGLRNIGGRLGTAVSHGCIRFSNRAITWLAERIAPGTPITIV